VPHGLRSTWAAGRACAAQRPVPAQGPEVAIHHSDAVLAAMNEWSERQHGGSGLTQRCRESAVSMRDAEDQARAIHFHFSSVDRGKNNNLSLLNALCDAPRS